VRKFPNAPYPQSYGGDRRAACSTQTKILPTEESWPKLRQQYDASRRFEMLPTRQVSGPPVQSSHCRLAYWLAVLRFTSLMQSSQVCQPRCRAIAPSGASLSRACDMAYATPPRTAKQVVTPDCQGSAGAVLCTKGASLLAERPRFPLAQSLPAAALLRGRKFK